MKLDRAMLPKSVHWLLWLIVFAVGWYGFVIHGLMPQDKGFGWDAGVDCAAADAFHLGLDPYYVKNLKNTELSYPYLPATLPVMGVLCWSGIMAKDFYQYFFMALAVGVVVLIAGVRSGAQPNWKTMGIVSVVTFFGFSGFSWVYSTGNIVMFDALLISTALFCFGMAKNKNSSFMLYAVGAVCLGLTASIKIVFVPIIAAVFFLPVRMRDKAFLFAVALVSFALPFAVSYVGYHDWFNSWRLAISGGIRGQHSPITEGENPSLFFIGQDFLSAYHIPYSNRLIAPKVFYSIMVSVVVLGGVWRCYSLLRRYKTSLREKPDFALYMVCLMMLAFSLCAPRLKEYALFNLAIYVAVLSSFVSGPVALAVAFLAIVEPLIWHELPVRTLALYDASSTLAAFMCYAVFLVAAESVLCGSDKRMRKSSLKDLGSFLFRQ